MLRYLLTVAFLVLLCNVGSAQGFGRCGGFGFNQFDSFNRCGGFVPSRRSGIEIRSVRRGVLGRVRNETDVIIGRR